MGLVLVAISWVALRLSLRAYREPSQPRPGSHWPTTHQTAGFLVPPPRLPAEAQPTGPAALSQAQRALMLSNERLYLMALASAAAAASGSNAPAPTHRHAQPTGAGGECGPGEASSGSPWLRFRLGLERWLARASGPSARAESPQQVAPLASPAAVAAFLTSYQAALSPFGARAFPPLDARPPPPSYHASLVHDQVARAWRHQQQPLNPQTLGSRVARPPRTMDLMRERPTEARAPDAAAASSTYAGGAIHQHHPQSADSCSSQSSSLDEAQMNAQPNGAQIPNVNAGGNSNLNPNGSHVNAGASRPEPVINYLAYL